MSKQSSSCALCLVKFSRYSCLYSRTQATDEGYVEDINGILNTGDLPNLYQLEDKATIMENMANVAKQLVSTDVIEVMLLMLLLLFACRQRKICRLSASNSAAKSPEHVSYLLFLQCVNTHTPLAGQSAGYAAE